MTEAREASAAMRALVRDTLARYLWTCEGDHAPTDAAKSDAAIDALLAAIAAQEAATEAAQAEVARLRAAVEAVRGDMSIAAGLSQPPHVVEYAIVIKRLDAALKETP